MKRKRMGLGMLVGCLLLGMAAPGWAQDAGKPVYYLGGGIAIPSSSPGLSDSWSTGFGLKAGAGYLLTPKLTLRASLEYDRLGVNKQLFLQQFQLDPSMAQLTGGTATLISALTGLKFGAPTTPDSPAVPYLIGGVGYFRNHVAAAQILVLGSGAQEILASTTNALQVNAGVGVSIRLGDRMDLFVEGSYNIAFTKGTSTQYFPIQVGVCYH